MRLCGINEQNPIECNGVAAVNAQDQALSASEKPLPAAFSPFPVFLLL